MNFVQNSYSFAVKIRHFPPRFRSVIPLLTSRNSLFSSLSVQSLHCNHCTQGHDHVLVTCALIIKRFPDLRSISGVPKRAYGTHTHRTYGELSGPDSGLDCGSGLSKACQEPPACATPSILLDQPGLLDVLYMTHSNRRLIWRTSSE